MRSTVLAVFFLALFADAQDLGPADPSADDYQKALRLLERKKWVAGQKALRKFIQKATGCTVYDVAKSFTFFCQG